MIDLRSDTVTRPTDEMREAMATAEVGDDVYGEDPTINELEATAARVVGTEAALFVPSGTMGNQIAIRVHTDRGDEALVERESHVVKYELGGIAQHAQAQIRAYDGGANGCPTPEQVAAGLVDVDLHRPGTGVLCLENTHNVNGGTAVPPNEIVAAAEVARDDGVPVHVDGARLFNAVAALDVDAADLVAPVDSVMFCLSKGLGAPVGSLLAGRETFIEQARRVRKLFGGGMRQAGVLAAAGLVALGDRDRLADDHANADLLADGLDGVGGLTVQTPDTNIVLVDVAGTGMDAAAFVEAAAAVDVLASEFGETVVRLTTHRDVTTEECRTAVDRLAALV
jgi:threonine aldolase